MDKNGQAEIFGSNILEVMDIHGKLQIFEIQNFATDCCTGVSSTDSEHV